MATTRDHTLQSDIAKMKTEPDGSFKRLDASFRNTIEKGGRFEPELDRYHLYVSYACRADVDPVYHSEHVKDLYIKVDPDYSGRFTVPVLWDKKTHTIVNNESSEIIRIFNTAFNDAIPADKAKLHFYPANLRAQIDELNEWIYPNINNGVYRAGFATSQAAYQKAVVELFEALDKVEKLLVGKDYLVGDTLTEADIRLWVTIIRFDPVYVGHFKCNIRTIRDGYPAIHRRVTHPLQIHKLYWNNDAFKSSTDFDHIKTHYYWSHPAVSAFATSHLLAIIY
ncbi:hypothetical protein DXG03_002959 [Asterophora parasitica]|uniref:GST C-terminal domain-containing protein n=1 Tax=Asterophora parasitica TaxID=117018 RepID=A0A9P7G1G5_9AGAR|nr:hypothetical protein DXG03_002959 [Asterophora parasitica]